MTTTIIPAKKPAPENVSGFRDISYTLQAHKMKYATVATKNPNLTYLTVVMIFTFSPNSQSIADRDISFYEELQLCQSVDWIDIFYYWL